MNQRQRLQTEKVKLHQSNFFDTAHVELSYDAAFLIDKQRQMIDQGQIRKHDACCVRRSMPHQAF
jgi:hypothetical protein